MNVLHVTPYYEEAWAYGGIPRVAAALCRGLARHGHRVTVCTTDARDARRLSGPPVRVVDGVEVRVFPNLSNDAARRWQLFLPVGLGAFLAEHARDFEVGHIHAMHNWPAALAAGHLRRAGLPYVLAPNGTAPLIERRRLAKALFDRTAGRGLLPGAAAVLAVSAAEERQLRALGVPGERIRRVPNPVDPGELAGPAQRWKPPGEPADGPIVLYLGRLSPRKGLEVLARAIALLQGRGRRLRLVFAGADDGAERPLRKLLRRLGVRAHFAGLLRGPARMAALAAADVVAYPGHHEVFGLVVLESILAGTPVVVADDSGAAELIAETGGGLVTRANDPTALAAALEAALDHPQIWSNRLPGAARIVKQQYAADGVCETMEEIYLEITRE